MLIELPPIYLASQSPRRQELLKQICIDFEIILPQVNEADFADDDPERYVLTLAKAKAQAGFKLSQQQKNYPVLGADTVVICDKHILEKPRNQEDAVRMLQQLSDTTHQVMTAVALVTDNTEQTCVVSTDVAMRPITETEAVAYWQTDEPHDKAGGYAIQGQGAIFVESIHGSYSNVVGLPLFETHRLLMRVLSAI